MYDWAVLVDILGDSSSIAEAKIKIFEKHKNDLAYLKSVAKNVLPNRNTIRFL
ncbi:MAG: CRISPR-associated endonuclease Cas9 REC1/REC2 domain-containing protein [Ruminococcus sp.]